MTTDTSGTAWWWATSAAERVPQPETRRFGTRADAESWLAEAWEDLLDSGVEEVFLWDGDERIFGPMSLSEA